jgi:hypothetical protein
VLNTRPTLQYGREFVVRFLPQADTFLCVSEYANSDTKYDDVSLQDYDFMWTQGRYQRFGEE